MPTLHRSHKLLLLLLLLAVFLVPFVITGVRAKPDPSVLHAAGGVLETAKTPVAQAPPGNAAAGIDKAAGNTIFATPAPTVERNATP